MADVSEKPGGRWLMRWRVEDASGKVVRRSRMFSGQGGRRGALAEANRVEAEARAADRIVSVGTMTFSAFVETRWLPHQQARTSARSFDTDRSRIRNVLPYLGSLDIGSIGASDLDAMTTSMLATRGWGRLYVRHHLHVAAAALRQAATWGLISGEPWRSAAKITVPKGRPKVATLEESDRLSAAFGAAGKPIAAALVVTLAETGCRPGEALALFWDAVDLDAGTISIWRAQEAVGSATTKSQTYRIKLTPKNDASVRTIRVGAGLVGILRSLKAWHAEQHLKTGGVWPASGLSFPGANGQLWSVPHAGRAIKIMADRIGVVAGAYSRRHGMASELLGAGVPVLTVAKRMGHTDATTTLRRYAHLLPGAEDAAVEALERRRIDQGRGAAK